MSTPGLINKVINKKLSGFTWMNDKHGYLF